MDITQLRQAALKGEDSQIQFKVDIRNSDALAAEVVAFSNSHGGHILIGVSNKGDIIGLNSADVIPPSA